MPLPQARIVEATPAPAGEIVTDRFPTSANYRRKRSASGKIKASGTDNSSATIAFVAILMFVALNIVAFLACAGLSAISD